MKNLRLLAAVACLGVVVAQACAGLSAPPPVSQDLGERLQQILDDSAAANGVIGAQAAVLIPGHAPWVGVTGHNGIADLMTPDLLIGTGSISKMYTAIAVLVLVDRGLLHYNDTIGTWFPATPNVNPSIRLERLLQQTSGLGDYSANSALVQQVLANPGRTFQPDELTAYIPPPLFAPGAAWNASNTNRLLLGIIVERVSGKSLGTFMRDELFKGLSSSWLAGDGPPPGPLANQWFVDASGHRTNMTTTQFGPALYSYRREVQASAPDIASFGQNVFAGSLLSPAARAKMLTIVPDDGGIAGQTGGGLGIRRYNYLGRVLYGHSGGTNNATALMLFDPATGIVAVVSVNQDGASHHQSHFRTTPALLQAAIAFVSR